MSSRNIAVRKDVYQALDRLKRPGESFTRVLLRLLQQRGPLDELAGSWGLGATVALREWPMLRRGGGGRR